MGKLRSGLSSNIIIDTAVAAERIRNFNEKELGVSRRRTDKMGTEFSLTLAIFSFPSDIFAANWLRCCLSDIDRVLPICRNSGCKRCEADQCRVRVDTMDAVEASDWRESDEFRFLCIHRAREERVASAAYRVMHLFDHGTYIVKTAFFLKKKRVPI